MSILPVKKQGKGGNELAKLHNEMDNLFQGLFSDEGWPNLEHRRWPAIDIVENENDFVVKADVPGCKADDIDISIHGSLLTISGEKKVQEEKKEKGYHHMERSYGSFRRDLTLGADLDSNKIKAKCKDGILTITLPKSEKTKCIAVEVKEE